VQEVTLRLPAFDSWISSLHESRKATVRILDCRPTDGGTLTVLVEVTAQDQDLDMVLDEIRGRADVTDVRLIKTKKGGMIGTVLMKGHSIARAVLETGGFCRSCPLLEPVGPDGRVEWKIALDQSRPIEALLQKIAALGMDAEVRSVSRADGLRELTEKQQALLELAEEKGHYNFPRRISITELARIQGISAATASEILRGAERRIVRNHFYAKREKPNNHKPSICHAS